MPDTSKPHQEPFARVRSALGAAGQQEARGLAALRDIEEQFETCRKALATLGITEDRDIERLARGIRPGTCGWVMETLTERQS